MLLGLVLLLVLVLANWKMVKWLWCNGACAWEREKREHERRHRGGRNELVGGVGYRDLVAVRHGQSQKPRSGMDLSGSFKRSFCGDAFDI